MANKNSSIFDDNSDENSVQSEYETSRAKSIIKKVIVISLAVVAAVSAAIGGAFHGTTTDAQTAQFNQAVTNALGLGNSDLLMNSTGIERGQVLAFAKIGDAVNIYGIDLNNVKRGIDGNRFTKLNSVEQNLFGRTHMNNLIKGIQNGNIQLTPLFSFTSDTKVITLTDGSKIDLNGSKIMMTAEDGSVNEVGRAYGDVKFTPIIKNNAVVGVNASIDEFSGLLGSNAPASHELLKASYDNLDMFNISQEGENWIVTLKDPKNLEAVTRNLLDEGENVKRETVGRVTNFFDELNKTKGGLKDFTVGSEQAIDPDLENFINTYNAKIFSPEEIKLGATIVEKVQEARQGAIKTYHLKVKDADGSDMLYIVSDNGRVANIVDKYEKFNGDDYYTEGLATTNKVFEEVLGAQPGNFSVKELYFKSKSSKNVRTGAVKASLDIIGVGYSGDYGNIATVMEEKDVFTWEGYQRYLEGLVLGGLPVSAKDVAEYGFVQSIYDTNNPGCVVDNGDSVSGTFGINLSEAFLNRSADGVSK